MDEEIKPVDYKVLARKYRPVNFASLIGQELYNQQALFLHPSQILSLQVKYVNKI